VASQFSSRLGLLTYRLAGVDAGLRALTRAAQASIFSNISARRPALSFDSSPSSPRDTAQALFLVEIFRLASMEPHNYNLEQAKVQVPKIAV
jgi:hypothetical protein